MTVTLCPDGSVAFGGYHLRPLVFQKGWISAQPKGGYEIKTPGKASVRMEHDGANVTDCTVSLAQIDGGKARIEYVFAAVKDVTLENIGCAFVLPAPKMDGRTWRSESKSGAFEHQPHTINLGGGKTGFFEFLLADTGVTLRFSSDGGISYLVQDDRKWSDAYTIRLGELARRRYAKGERAVFSFVVSANEPLAVADHRPYVISSGAEWMPLDYRRNIESGSALDFSQMGFTDAPAGKYGWLRNAGGHFEFERRPGRPQRFYGVNLCGTANFPDHALADEMIVRFKRLGYNAIRVHHHDAGTVSGSADGLTLNADNMERLDYLLASAIREGLYVTTDTFVSRSRAIKWRHIGVDRNGLVDMQLFKALCAVYDPAFDNWAAYARNLMLHTNRYTGRRYADEPALPLISLVNEGGFFMGWSRGVRDDPRILANWKAWLSAKRAANPSFAAGMSADELPKSYWDKSTRPVVEQWAGELEVKMVARMKAYLRGLGCKALITNDNCGSHYTARNGLDGDYDYIDDHFYVDHPNFLDKPWRLPSRCPNVNPLLGDKPIMPVEHDWPRVPGKPFTITEWNFSGPGRYRGVGGILTGATGALQNWDGLWRFAYSHSRDSLGDADIRSPGYFDLASDPLSQASDRASICLFLRGDLLPHKDSCLRIDRKRGSFTIDTPRTCGGFVPDGELSAGAMKATVSGAPATVWVHALDGGAVSQSRRLLLTHLTDVQGEGVKFMDESMKVLLKWGRRPLVRNGTADVTLHLLSAADYDVYALATSGRRLRKVESSADGDTLRFKASIARPDGACILYEICGK